jgi:hypothetical protein
MHPGLGTLSVQWTDPISGSSQVVGGPTSWASSAPTIVAVTVSPGNPQIANLNAPGPLGTATITASVDADPGPTTQPVSATIVITVHA